MLNGVAAAFVLAAGWSGRLDADCACIEIDEASQLGESFLTLSLTTWSDQSVPGPAGPVRGDRHHHEHLKEVMQSAPEMKVIVNGDDALSASSPWDAGNPYITYGINEKVTEDSGTHEIREGRFCKKCGAPLHYEFYHYSQLGVYQCTQCDFRRPDIQYNASDIEVGDHLAFTVEGRRITAHYRGFYNVYNSLAAYTAARASGLELPHFNDMLAALIRRTAGWSGSG